LSAWLAGCACPSRNALYQTSTIDALLAGVYDGDLSLRELRAHGDFGIGTYDNLDGEMVLLDGVFHQIKASGRVVSPDPAGETPFAAVCAFRPEMTVAIPAGADLQAVAALVDREAPNQNQFCAIRIDGQFKTMRTRSVPPQKRPFPPLKEVAATQPTFDMENVAGTVLGFRCPPFVAGVNVPGYHLHFISRDRARGGHVLTFELVTGTAQVDMLDRFEMQLPATEDFATVDLARDRQSDLKGVEKKSRCAERNKRNQPSKVRITSAAV
jgi:acetolactate decarboxylase